MAMIENNKIEVGYHKIKNNSEILPLVEHITRLHYVQ